ncbi:MAG: hypothetical protein EHM19_00970 [Candidatus Latescibacterota bacterium]|nr:MAG: hypothetical protein EHM19_00970 [Candidatus Latescibacterota bacterium]
MKKLLVLAICLLVAVPVVADELQKKIEAEIGIPAQNERALDCTGAEAIACGQVVSSTTVGGPNNVAAYSCVSWTENGPEKVYVLTTTGINTITATLSGMTVDLDVFLLSSCSEAACIAYGNTIATATCKPAGTYYVVVDGYGTAAGAFTLTIACTPCAEPPVNDQCSGAIEIPCGAINLAGTTVGATDNYSPGAFGNPCTGYTALGMDVTYKFTAAAGASLNLSYTSSVDASFYVVTDCANPSGTCVVGADDTFTGQAEVISHVFAAGGLYYLILDSYSGGGTFTLTGTLSCPDAVEETSWGRVKTLYR